MRRFVPTWRAWRRLAQLALLALFVWLFRATEYRGKDELVEPANLLFRIDPLTAAAAMLAGRQLLWSLWPALAILVATLVLGRFFCGWVCPLGTLLDVFHRVIRPIARLLPRLELGARLRPVRYVLLVFILAAAAIGLPLVGYVDPLALLYRAAAFWIDPHLYRVAAVMDADSRAYEFARDHLLPFSQKTYALAGVSLGILAAIFALEMIGRRFWCRYLCPLGAMLGIASRFSLLRRVPVESCGTCPAAADCAATCRMDAFDAGGKLSPDECTLCMDCVGDCPVGVARFRFGWPKTAPAPVSISRRAVLTALAAGVALPAVTRAARVGRTGPADPTLLRPPGVGNEAEFLNLCVRCGLCMKVCPTGGLQPAGGSSGIDAIFSPRLVPRVGYCEVACTLCGQVCPTKAIPRLTRHKKEVTIIGKAVIDTDRCLPWADDEQCICCEEHCPVPEKAIEYEEVEVHRADGQTVTLQRPRVDLDRCIGCGICENKCPVEGESAIRVARTETVQPGSRVRARRRTRGRARGQ